MHRGRTGRAALAAAITAAALAATAAPSAAKEVTARGAGTEDRSVKLEIDLVAKLKKGNAVGKAISAVRMHNARYECQVSGMTGRHDYSMGYYEYPVLINRRGKFKRVEEHRYNGHVLSRYTLKGTTKGKRRKLVLRGTFEPEVSAGGLEYPHCIVEPVQFRVTVKV